MKRNRLLAASLVASLGIVSQVCKAQFLSSDPTTSEFRIGGVGLQNPLNRSESRLPERLQFPRIATNRLPFYFVRNDGQFGQQVKYYSVSGKMVLYFTADGIYFSFLEGQETENVKLIPGLRQRKTPAFENRRLNRKVAKMVPVGASRQLQILGAELQSTRFNYFLGNDAGKWQRNVPVYRSVVYTNVYPGIDLKFYGNSSGQLEYDIVVRPGADPSRIRLAYEGIRDLHRNPGGDLSIRLGETTFLQRRPRVIQHVGSKTIEVHGAFRLHSDPAAGRFVYGFELGAYDRKRSLFIDPVISFATYLGGSELEDCLALDRDFFGYLYVTGLTLSPDFPVTTGAYQTSTQAWSAFITKLSPDGSWMVYSTYLGGSGGDYCGTIKVDETGAAYVGCSTQSADFPVVNAFQANRRGDVDAAVAKLSPDGSGLLYSTYLGGTGLNGEDVLEIALHNHQVYAGGVTSSADFPVRNPLQGNYSGGMYDGFVTVLNASGTDLIYSTYMGGRSTDEIFGIEVDNSGAAYVVGASESPNFPVTPGAFDTVCANGRIYCEDAFVSKIAANGASLVYSTFLGGSSSDGGFAIEIDAAGAAYVTGETISSDFPMVHPAQSNPGSVAEAFISKLSPDGSALVYSTYLGGWDSEAAYAIAVDVTGAAYVTGMTRSPNFPKVKALPVECAVDALEWSAFVTKVTPDGGSWEYSTCLGGTSYDWGFGIVVDDSSAAYVTGSTLSTDFPVRNALQPNRAGVTDGFIAKISCDSVTAPSVFEDAGPAVFSVHLCQPRNSDITIDYFTSDGSAIAGSDYVSTSGVMTIRAGDTEGTIEVPLLADDAQEAEEIFFVHLTSGDIDLGEWPAEARLLDSDALLYDNFEDAVMDWEVTKGRWSEGAGVLVASGDRGAGAFAPVPWIPSGASGCGMCTIETRLRVSSGELTRVILEAWYQNSGNKVELTINELADKWVLKQRFGGHVVAKAKAAAIIDPSVEYDISLSFDGVNFKLSVSGIPTISMQAGAPPFGRVGFKVKGSTGRFYFIRVF